jgi:hypothetical protein
MRSECNLPAELVLALTQSARVDRRTLRRYLADPPTSPRAAGRRIQAELSARGLGHLLAAPAASLGVPRGLPSDLARAAGVSLPSAQKFLGGCTRLRPSTKRRICAALRRAGLDHMVLRSGEAK